MTVDKAHCFFEQTGTFKREFIKLGIPAEDYDIKDEFGETDHRIDLFADIERAYDGAPSAFDGIGVGDLIFAFFPCIYFTGSTNPLYFNAQVHNFRTLGTKEKCDAILSRADKRNEFYKELYRLVAVCEMRALRLVVENPFSNLHFLHNNFLKEPDVVDGDRSLRGDTYKKPTGYWFFGCEPTRGESFQPSVRTRAIYHVHKNRETERSMISPDYARNFICDFILGKRQAHTNPEQLTLFRANPGAK